MRKSTMMVALVALLVAIFAAAAYAETIEGTNNNDFLYESSDDDQMYGNGGDDNLYADSYPNDTDELYGGSNNDNLYAADGDGMDVLVGGKGKDSKDDFCYGDIGDKFKSCDGNVTRVR